MSLLLRDVNECSVTGPFPEKTWNSFYASVLAHACEKMMQILALSTSEYWVMGSILGAESFADKENSADNSRIVCKSEHGDHDDSTYEGCGLLGDEVLYMSKVL